MSPLAALAAVTDWRTRAVVARNATVFAKTWRTAMIPPALEPVLYFLAFGLGLGGFVEGMPHGGRTLDYATYVAPGMLAFTAFATPFYESLYAAYVRMFFQKTWDGILATQVELEHLLWGEILWASLRGVVNSSIVALVLACVHAAGFVELHLAYLPVLPLVGAVVGAGFAAIGLVVSVLVPSIDHMNYAVFLFGVPLSFTSNTYFPVDVRVPGLAGAMAGNPLFQLAEGCRFALAHGRLTSHLLAAVGLGLLCVVVGFLAAVPIARRRMLDGA